MEQHPIKRRQKDRSGGYYRDYEWRRESDGELFKTRFKFILKRIESS